MASADLYSHINVLLAEAAATAVMIKRLLR